jgi:hypothetical protein
VRISEFFQLGRTQAFLDFVDVQLDTDLPVFVDPTALRGLKSGFGHECASLVQHFFQAVLNRIQTGDDDAARRLLSSLNERNEFHLGYSQGQSQGHGFGDKSANSVWEALSRSQASRSGLLQDLEDTCLLIEGIGRDMVSDAVCNIIRGPLIRYTQSACAYYGVPLSPDVASGPIWDPVSEHWGSALLPLPMTTFGKVILVPKILVRHRLSYELGEYYRHYLLPEMQLDELSKNSSLVEVLRDGRRRVTKKSLVEKYGSDKLAVVEQTIKHPQALTGYREQKQGNPPPPLLHEQFAEIEGVKSPDWDALIDALRSTPVGNADATNYENVVEQLLTAIFYPSLCSPTKQREIHDGRKRIDITYTNESRSGFFNWLGQHYPSAFIFVECKNYGRELGNPELDQLAGRFSPMRGVFGLLVCRSLEDVSLFERRCIDTAKDQRGFIIALTDDDLVQLAVAERDGQATPEFPLLMRRFRALVE